ncbi:MAG: ankyrin repeat domain-containing protein, partial [Phycisphaerae bacterium]|nr:ankyrin repeat domain-containing protein [Phycisphaerae bacterium]
EVAQIKSDRAPAYECPSPVVASSQGYRFPWRKVLLWSWTIASVILSLRLTLVFLMGVGMLGQAVPTDGTRIREAIRTAGAKLGITQQVRIYTNDRVRSPIIWCWSAKPTLLVPRRAGANDSIDWVSILCHELAHYKRRDHIAGLFAELAVCILPWQALLWWAKKRLLMLSERACDDWVLACGQPGADYVDSLLDLVPHAQMAFVPAVLRSKKGLAVRVRRILMDKCGNPRAGLLWVLAVCVATACIGMGVAFAQNRPAKLVSSNSGDQKSSNSIHEAAAAGHLNLVKSLIKTGTDVNVKGRLDYTPLHHAAENGHADLVKFLISSGADLEARNHNGRTPPALAACKGHKGMVELLITKGADFNTKDIWYKKLLHHAAENGHADLARFLIAKGADIESQTNLDYTALSLAASQGHRQMVELLISKGADVNTKQQMKYSPLHYAAMRGHYEIAKLLVAAGADVDAEDLNQQTPLYKAVKAGNKDIAGLLAENRAYICFPALHFAAFMNDLNSIKELIEDGTDVDSKDKENQTPLLYAALCGNKQVVEYLVDKGADINARRSERDQPILHKIARHGDKDMVELLISKGANVNATANTGAATITPLDHAVLSGHADVTAVLLAHGADPDIRGYCSVMPLHRAAQKGRTDLARMLLDHGANVNIKGGSIEITPLHWAAGHAEVAKLLISKGADVNAKDKDGATPLHYAARGKGPDVAKILIDNGADINAKDSRGRTPLHDAAGNGNDQTVELLIERGAQVDVKSDTGATPLYLAASGTKDSKEAVELLLAAGADIKVQRTTKPDQGFGLLHVAIKNSNERVVEFLIAKGLDINAETADGRTPLELARDTTRLGSAAKKRRKTIVELLLRHGANR